MIRALLIGFVGAASFAAVYLLTPPKAETDAPASSASPAAESVAAASAPADPPEDPDPVGLELRPGAETANIGVASTPRAIRDVTPDTMTAGPRITGTLARVDPPAATAKARTERLFNPIVVAAGTLKLRDREIHLAGIDAPAFETACGEAAARWPCGRVARAALRSFIHGRAIECAIPEGADRIPDPAACMVGGEDISQWLVAQGWAKRHGDAFADAEKAAMQARLGLWGSQRPDAQVSASTGD